MAIRSLMSVAITTTLITSSSSPRRGEALNISSTVLPSLRVAVIRLRECASPPTKPLERRVDPGQPLIRVEVADVAADHLLGLEAENLAAGAR